MLRQEVDNQIAVTAAQTRVKSEEFAQALATIEARKMEEARRLEGTLVPGAAVSDLQLDLTPEQFVVKAIAKAFTSNDSPSKSIQ